MYNSEEYKVAFKLFGVYFLCLTIIGSLGNAIGIYVCLKQKLRETTTFIFLCFIFIADTLTLYIWCLNHFFEAYYGFYIEEFSIWTCRFGFFLQQFSLEWSSWLLVIQIFNFYSKYYFKTQN
jgi:hypothetical protein